MNTVSASFFSSYANTVNSLSSVAQAGATPFMDAIQDSSSSDLFGAAFSIGSSESSNSDSGLPDLLTYSATDTKKAKDALRDTYSALFDYLTEMASIAAHQDPKKSDDKSTEDDGFTPHAGYSAQFVGDPSSPIDVLANSGPLPKFLAQVETSMHLDTQHKHALENIAWDFRNATDSLDTVNRIDAALDAAGITA